MDISGSSEDESEEEVFRWNGVGCKVAASKRRKRHTDFDGFCWHGVDYESEEHIKVAKPGGGWRLAKIISCYHEHDKKAKVEVKWLWKKSEVDKKLQKKFGRKELWLDDSPTGSQPIIITEIIKKVFVYPTAKALKKADTNKNDSYFCYRKYSMQNHEVSKIPTSSSLNSDNEDSGMEEENSGCDIEIVHQQPPRGQRRRKKKNMTAAEHYHEAFTQLQLCAVPDRLPCREREHREIHAFIEGSIRKGGTGSGLYISGMPGTGKTATLRQIKRELKVKEQNGELRAFRFIEINAMKLPTPAHAYTELYRMLTGTSLSPTRASNKLKQLFSAPNPDNKVTVLLLDELDYLLTRNENVIYTLFDWPTRQHARLVVVGIANTMDLIEKLTPRVQSRLGLKRIKFGPYKREDIVVIVTERLKRLGQVFDLDAIHFCAAKVAGVSGDVRRALQICRRATKICEAEAKNTKARGGKYKLVGMEEIDKAIKSLFASSDMQFLSNLSLYPRFLMVTLAQYCMANKTDHGERDEVFRRMNQYLDAKAHSRVTFPEFEEVLQTMASQRLLVKNYKVALRTYDLRLNVQIEDLAHCMTEDSEMSAILATV